MLCISGVIVILFGIILAVIGICQGRKRISDEDNFIPAEAEIVSMDSKIKIIKVCNIPVVTKEYSPLIRFITSYNEEILAPMPYAMKIFGEYKEIFGKYKSGDSITVRYNPKEPYEFYYHSKKSFRIREVAYKFLAAAVLIILGLFMIWCNTLV